MLEGKKKVCGDCKKRELFPLHRGNWCGRQFKNPPSSWPGVDDEACDLFELREAGKIIALEGKVGRLKARLIESSRKLMDENTSLKREIDILTKQRDATDEKNFELLAKINTIKEGD